MLKQVKVLAAAVLVVGSSAVMGPARAQNNCGATLNSFEDVYCDAKVLIRADDDLNATYQKLLKKLSPAGQAALRRSQRAWVAARNNDCTGRDPKFGDVIYTGCAVDRTTSRTNFLNDRLRECLSGGCQLGKLN